MALSLQQNRCEMETVKSIMEWAAFALDALAVLVIAGGAAIATIRFGLIRAFFFTDRQEVQFKYKQQLGNGLLLGLDLLVASDVIDTVVLERTLENVAALGLLVIVRIALTWSILIEVEGRWPWQAHQQSEGVDR